MKDYDNNMRGVLFKNDKATDENKQPQYRGNCEIDGKEYSISSWIKTAKSGVKFMSLSFEVKDGSPQSSSSASADTDAPF